MRILIIGGTRFVGLAIVHEALARGHQVDVFHRGNNPLPPHADVRELLGDRNADLAPLRDGAWDVVIDTCAYRPHEVVAMLDALQGRFQKYVLVSSVSVYAEDIAPHSTESAARHATTGLDGLDLTTCAIDAETYGPLKVLCEDALRARHADHLLIRPTYVVGPGDYTMRFPHWVGRIAAGGEVDVPGPADEPLRYIDARDLAAFVLHAMETDARGAFSVAAADAQWTFGKTMQSIVDAVAPPGTQLNWLSIEAATASGETFPLWSGGTYPAAHQINCDAAFALGLQCRPLEQATRDVLKWLQAQTPKDPLY